jgi:hypothetical protein
MKYLGLSVMLGMTSLSQVSAMQPLSDIDLANRVGQALLNLNYVAPNASGNPNTNIGFYRLGFNADLNLNANIAKLQLGCGGANGAGVCDVDIDRLRFTGFVTANNIKNDQGPATDFLLRDPYIELAIKNPTTASTREFVGARFGARQAAGMMSFGERPYNADGTALANNDPTTHSGINRLTADMDIYVNRGVVPIRFCAFGCFGDATEANAGNQATINLNLPAAGNNIFLDQYYSRASSFKLGELKTETDILGLDVPASLVQDFRFIHNISVGTAGSPASDFYISLSALGNNAVADTDGDTTNRPTDSKPVDSTNWIKWQKLSSPTTWSPSARGWSFSLPEVRVEDFRAAPIKVTALGAFGVALENLDLKQVPADNCYGSLTFC